MRKKIRISITIDAYLQTYLDADVESRSVSSFFEELLIYTFEPQHRTTPMNSRFTKFIESIERGDDRKLWKKWESE